MKFALMVTMVVVMGSALRHGSRSMMKVPGAPEAAQFSSEEADLMSTVFNSALRLFSGSASRDELAGELSDKLYAGRAEAGNMSELGIELVKPGAGSAAPAKGAGAAPVQPGASLPAKQSAKQTAKQTTKPTTRPGTPSAEPTPVSVRPDLLARLGRSFKPYAVEMGLIPVVFLGMVLMQRIRRRRSRLDEFMPLGPAINTPAESEAFEMKHAVHSFGAEDFELLVALIYQRQGYRVSMPAGLSGGRGGDFTLARKSERVLVQCKKLSLDHRVPVERVRELREAVTAAGATRGMYVASCGFTWDARNFAKANGVTLINARTLDELITAARQQPDEDLLAVSQWVPKFMSKVELTLPLCPACGAKMDQINISDNSAWLCSQRPECRGRRSSRKYRKPVVAAAPNTGRQPEGVIA